MSLVAVPIEYVPGRIGVLQTRGHIYQGRFYGVLMDHRHRWNTIDMPLNAYLDLINAATCACEDDL